MRWFYIECNFSLQSCMLSGEMWVQEYVWWRFLLLFCLKYTEDDWKDLKSFDFQTIQICFLLWLFAQISDFKGPICKKSSFVSFPTHQILTPLDCGLTEIWA